MSDCTLQGIPRAKAKKVATAKPLVPTGKRAKKPKREPNYNDQER